MNMTTTEPLRWTRIMAGMYEAVVGPSERESYRINSVEPDPGHGYGSATEWMLYYPGEVVPDTITATLRDAKACAQSHRSNP